MAIVHPWFLEEGGAERVADVLAEMYPEADIFALSADPLLLPLHIREKRIFKSFLDKLLLNCAFLRRFSFPIYPCAIESLDVSRYDLIISTCPPVMGLSVSQDAVHICYCHTPAHAWWDSYSHHQAKLPYLPRLIFVATAVFYRMWEFSAMQRVDRVIANSQYVSRRVFKYFRRESTVIYPPVDTSVGFLRSGHDDYYLTVSRITASKRIDVLIHACNRLGRNLIIVGTGNHLKKLKSIAGPTITFLGHLQDADLYKVYAACRAFLFASDEDFGMAVVEAQAFGRPVIAYGRGGSLETVRVGDARGNSDTGVYFSEQTIEAVVDGIQRFEAAESGFVPHEIQQHARSFDKSVFIARMREFVGASMSDR